MSTLLPGLDGIPFRLHPGQKVPDIKEDDIQQRRPKEVYDAKVDIFDLSVPEQLNKYREQLDKCAKGTAMLSREEINWNSEKNSYIVFLRTLEVYLEVDDRSTGNDTEKLRI